MREGDEGFVKDKRLPDLDLARDYRMAIEKALRDAYRQGVQQGWSARPRMSGLQYASTLILTLLGTTTACGAFAWWFLTHAIKACS